MPETTTAEGARPGRTGPGPSVWTALAGAVAVALTAGLFADWDSYTGPLARATVGWGFPLPGRVTSPSADLVVLVAVCAAALHAVWRPPAAPSGALGTPRLLLRSWSVPVTAFALGALAGAVAGLAVGGSVGGAAETLWHLLAQTGHGGLFGLLHGAPTAAAVAVAARFSSRRGSLDGSPHRRSPYAVLTALLLLGPLAALAAGTALLDTADPADCSPLACASPVDELLLNGEIGVRLAVPCWAAAVATAAFLRVAPRIRAWPVWTHALLATGAAGLAVTLLSGLVVGSDV
ncbi:hypothetical protein AB0I72_03850 [Nocardiopsis sp. NPDC049922]|uniref:hypothetical protein n=1 Tax=Nocardiopsis sp. NPDC049922 TaxID=3155157 RepID=UPI0033CABC84